MIYDTGYDPWRLIKVMVNENRGDDPIIDFSWTMDCQRVITITHSVRTMISLSLLNVLIMIRLETLVGFETTSIPMR